MTKRDVCEFLGRSKRTIDRYMEEGMLPFRHVKGRNGVEAAFPREAVEAFKRDEHDAPVTRAATRAVTRVDVPAPESKDLSDAPLTVRPEVPFAKRDSLVVAAEDFLGLLRTIHDAQPAPPLLPWLTLDEAAEASGLPRAWLLEYAINGGAEGGSRIDVLDVGAGRRGGRFRFRRESLTK